MSNAPPPRPPTSVAAAEAARQAAIREVLDEAESLELFPPAALKIRSISSDPNANLTDMEEAVAMDPALSAQILRLANAPFYGLPRGVGSLRQAIFVLGFRAIQGLALSLALVSVGRTKNPWRRRTWQHSLLTGAAARFLSNRVPGADAHEAFVAGMLHDLGEMILLEVIGTPYQEVLAMLPDPHPQRKITERARFGCHHAEVGAACLEQWLLPDPLCKAVALHHSPKRILKRYADGPMSLAELVWMADSLAALSELKIVDRMPILERVARSAIPRNRGLTAEDFLGITERLNDPALRQHILTDPSAQGS